MNRLAGSLVAGLSLLTFLALLLVFVLPVLLDSSAIKGKIAQIFQERTGRSLVIDGDLKFSFFPEASVNFGHAHVDNPEGFSQQTMATFQGATAVVRGIGLLLGHLDVVELSIDNLEVTLERRQDGVTNWPDLPNRLIDATVWRQPMERAAVSWPEDWLAVQMGLSGLAAVSTGGIQLQGARINWRDRQKDQQYSLENVSVVSRSVGRGATGLELNGNWKWHPARMSGRVSLDFET
ncbi:MAG TPA: AsmA family protein, partial [Magnetococcales bacterium]|nr:AsmA family protein [Magnetococcales bacterium]